MIHRLSSFFCCSLLMAASATAAPIIDQSNDVGGSAAISLLTGQFLAQSFTSATDGLLTQIDVQVGRYEGAVGDVTFELREMINGAPTIDDKGVLFSTTLDIDNLPLIGSLSDPSPFTSIDVSSAGIHAQPGAEYAVSLLRSGGSPVAAWRSDPLVYSGGSGFTRSLLSSPWSPSVEDFGFQTWVDPFPTLPYKLRVDPTFDVQYRPGDVISLIEGEESLLIGGFSGFPDFPEQRPIIEYSLSGLPEDAKIQAAQLMLDLFVSSGSPRIEIIGYPGDGLASLSDGTVAGSVLAITEPTSASSSGEFILDENYIASVVETASHLGVRMRSLDLPEYVGFYTMEDDFPTVLPPRLFLEFTLSIPGDFDDDRDVDGNDLTDSSLGWEARFGDDLGGISFLDWQRHLGVNVPPLSVVQAVPEPSALSMLAITIGICIGTTYSRLRRR